MNALKSLFSSIHSKKALAQLQDLGIEMYRTDENGQKHFRKLHDVFVDLMITSRTTSRNMEKDLLAISGGKFQWSKVASVLGSYQDFIHAYGMSISSAGFSNDQIAAQLDTISRKMQQLKATMTGIAAGIGASGLSAYIKNIISSINGFAQAIQRIPTQTYEMIGSFVKWGAIGASTILIIRTLVKGIIGMQTAYKLVATAQAAETVATQANTLSKLKNNASRLLGINAARSQATATLLSAGALTAEAGAAGAATVATGGFAATVTAATAGLNLILAAVAAAVVAFLGYNSVVGTAIEETDTLAQKAKDDITVQQQQIENLEAQKDFVATLIEAHVKYQEAINNSKEGTEQHIHAEEDLKATDKELADIIGEDAASNIDWSRNVQDIIKQEQGVFTKKIENEKTKLAEVQKAQIQYTQNQIEWTKNRIDALKNEAYGWDALKDVIERFVRFLGEALVTYGETLRGIQNSIRETPILGQIAKMSGFGDVGSWSHTTINSIIAKGQQMQSFSGQPIIDAMKKVPIMGKVWQGMIDHFYDFSVLPFGSHSNRQNELAYQEESLSKLEKELIDQKIQFYRDNTNPTNSNDSGEIPEGGDGKKGKKDKTPKGAKEADNSVEAMLYRHMIKDLKLSHAQAIGELANIQQESQFNYQSDNGTHKGLYQFDSTRWGRYQDWLARTGRTDSAVSQVDFRHLFESKEVEYEAKQNRRYLLSGATTPKEYAAAFNEFVERSGEKEGSVGYANRMRYADELDKRFAKKNGEENFDDVLGARTDAYKALKQQYDEEIEKLQTERAKVGQGVSAEEKIKIFEKMMGLDKGGDNVIFAEVKKAQKDYAKLLLDGAKEEAKRTEAIKKTADTQTKAVEKMADGEIAFAEKIGLINKADVRNYNYEKNERNYATNKPLLDAKLGATVDLSKGTAKDMMEVYQKLLYAKSDMERKQYAERIFWLSRDVEATSKALNEELKLEESYQKKRRELNEEAFTEKNRYALKFIDSLSTAIGNGLEGILNRTKSFAEAFTDIFKAVVNDIIKLFSEDFAKRIKKWLTNIIFKPKATGNEAGSFYDMDNLLGRRGNKKRGGGFDLMSWAGGKNGLSLLGGGRKGGNPFLQAMGLTPNLASQVKATVTPVVYTLRNSVKTTFDSLSNLTTQGMNTISAGVQTGTQAMSMTFENYKNLQVVTNEVGDNAIVAQNQATAATVRTTTTTMMGWLMMVLALFSLFGGHKGDKKSTSTSSENLGRAPETYYMTPTPVLQSTNYQVPSFDIGGNIEEDMFAFVHKNEMILTPEQADVIRNTARTGGNIDNNGGTNTNVKSNISVTTVDSKGFDRVLKNYNRDLSKNIKTGIRNGYLTAKGLI